MHQPDSRHPETREEDMPWARLHALKDYYDMARLVDEAPVGTRVTFNLTPMLLSQLTDLATRGPRDAFYKICRKPVSHLRLEDRLFILNNFFSVNEERMLRPLPDYERLLKLSGKQGGRLTWLPPRLTNQDYLDIQVLFHLAWCGRTLREDPLVRRLIEKGAGFDEGERNALLDLQDRFLGGVIPLYRRLWEEDRVELSTTPLHHPILPLLVDTRTAREGNPQAPIDGIGFRFPEDAREQLQRGRELAAQVLGKVPAGMWPSEGSVSDAVIRLMEPLGIQWIATDRQILDRSLVMSGTHVGAAPHLRPWRLRSTEAPLLFFRDTAISDRIGFTWSRWAADAAVNDFLARVRTLANTDPKPDEAVLPIILDGENAWEYYEDNGTPFLSGLYAAVHAAPDLSLCTMSDAVRACPARILPRIQAGSWIHACLDTWVGHPEKNRAWELLTEARFELKDQMEGQEADPRAILEAREHLLRAEASDWFWWLGDDHPSYYKNTFEELFRTNLRAAWRALGRPCPAALHQPIPDPRPAASTVAFRRPFALIHPVIDGRNHSYYPWVGAGTLDTNAQSSSIFVGKPVISRLDFGFDLHRLYFRLTPVEGRARDVLREARVRIHLRALENGGQFLVVGEAPITSGEASLGMPLSTSPSGERVGEWAIDRVCELAVAFAPLGLVEGTRIGFALELSLPDGLAERLPLEGLVESIVPTRFFDQFHWSL
jgi:alpha-amylase/alpha-mannosidase (GH57 family)